MCSEGTPFVDISPDCMDSFVKENVSREQAECYNYFKSTEYNSRVSFASTAKKTKPWMSTGHGVQQAHESRVQKCTLALGVLVHMNL